MIRYCVPTNVQVVAQKESSGADFLHARSAYPRFSHTWSIKLVTFIIGKF